MKNDRRTVEGVEKSNSKALVPTEIIEKKIFVIRGLKVMIDKDLAILYGVTTKRLNEQVKRNIKRFPPDFMLKLSKIEAEIVLGIQDPLRSQIATLKNGGIIHLKRGQHIKHLPYVFTEQGIAMLSGVLNSDRAIIVNIAIMRAFVKLRQMISKNKELEHKFIELEHKVERHDADIINILNAIRQIIKEEEKPKGKFGFARD
jgi:hypothetical protein